MLNELIDEFDNERNNFFDALANGNESAWEESMKKLKIVYKKIQIELDSLDYPSFKMIEKLAEINRMMGEMPHEAKFWSDFSRGANEVTNS